MTTLISRAGVIDDAWTFLGADDPLPPRGDVLLTLARWKRERSEGQAHAGRVGVVLEPADDPAEIAGALSSLALVAVRFPHFTDGRGYSTARLLRERYGFAGELRATGDVTRDQLFYLSRVGFDTFELRSGEDAVAALSAFHDFSEAYQSSVERPDPLFRRREAIEG
jgi:uncharacterized protein (DUF934 family)